MDPKELTVRERFDAVSGYWTTQVPESEYGQGYVAALRMGLMLLEKDGWEQVAPAWAEEVKRRREKP